MVFYSLYKKHKVKLSFIPFIKNIFWLFCRSLGHPKTKIFLVSGTMGILRNFLPLSAFLRLICHSSAHRNISRCIRGNQSGDLDLLRFLQNIICDGRLKKNHCSKQVAATASHKWRKLLKINKMKFILHTVIFFRTTQNWILFQHLMDISLLLRSRFLKWRGTRFWGRLFWNQRRMMLTRFLFILFN